MQDLLEKIAQRTSVSVAVITKFASEMNASPGYEGFDRAISRYMSIIGWVSENTDIKLLGEAELVQLKLLQSNQKLWQSVLPPDVPGRVDSNTPVKSIADYPLYAVLTVFSRYENKSIEPLLIPLMSIFFLLAKYQVRKPSFYKTTSAVMRSFFTLSQSEVSDLITLSQKPHWDGGLRTLLLMYRKYEKLSWLKSALKALGIKIKAVKRRNSSSVQQKYNQSTAYQPSRKRETVDVVKKVIWTINDVEIDALDPSESGATEEVLLFDKAENRDFELAYRRFHSYSEMDNQFLSDVWKHIRPQEIEWLSRELNRLVLDDPELGLCIALSIATSREIEDVVNFKVDHGSFNKYIHGDELTIFSQQGYWCHPKFQPEQAFSPNEEQLAYLQKTESFVLLNFPDSLKSWIMPHIHEDSKHVRDSIDGVDALLLRADNWIKKVRKESGYSRFTLTRLRDWAMYEMLSSTQDPALVSQVFWIDSASSASAYYATFGAERLQYNYSSVISNVLGNTDLEPAIPYFVGSEMKLNLNFMINLVAELSDNLIEAKDNLNGIERLVGVHNSITTYTLTMLMYETGHRPVSDLFELVDGLDTEAQIHFIADKTDGQHDNGRIVWLSKNTIGQLKAYKKHLRVLASHLVEFDVELAKRVEFVSNDSYEGKLPQFFYLKYRKNHPPKPQQITPRRFKSELGISLPLNLFRHNLAYELRQQDVPAEFINYQLDHIKFGQEFSGLYSTLSGLDITQRLTPALQKISENVRWSVQKGLSRAKRKEVKAKKVHDQVYWVNGIKRRAEKRREHRNNIRRVVTECLKSVKTGTVTKDWLQKIESYLNDAFTTYSEKQRAKRIIHRTFKNQHDQAEVLFKQEWEVALPVKKNSSFIKVSQASRLRLARELRKKILGWVMSANHKTELDELMAMMIASAIMNGGLVSKEYVQHLMARFEQSKRFASFVWIDFENTAYQPAAIRRWFFDVITINLLNLLLKKHRDNIYKPSWTTLNTVFKSKLQVKNVGQLIEHAVCLIMIELPAVVAHYAIGNVTAASLTEPDFLRIASGKAMLKDMEIASEQKTKTYQLHLPIPTDELEFEVNMKFRSLIKRVIKDKSISKELRLTKLLNLRESFRSMVSAICLAYVEWLRRLIIHGRKKIPGLGSIINYHDNTINCIFESCWKVKDVFDLDIDDFISLYDEALSYVKDTNRPYVATLLSDFHSSLVKSWNVPAIDFSIIEPRCIGRSVRPNLITESEFQTVEQQLSVQTKILSNLLFRGRLRTKELINMNSKDVHIGENNTTYLDVRSTSKSKTKSQAGIRTFPLSDYLPSLGGELVSSSLQGLSNCKLGELFTNRSFDEFKQILRSVTGDPKTIIYDLRHSGVSLSTLALLEDHGYSIQFLVENNLLPDDIELEEINPKRAGLYRESLITGHASPATTTSSYCHTLDLSLLSKMTERVSIQWGLNPAVFFELDVNQLNYLKRKYPKNYLYKVQQEILKASQITNAAESNIFFQPDIKKVNENRGIELCDVMEIFNLVQKNKSKAFIALAVNVTIELVEKVISISAQAEQQSGYRIQSFKTPKSWLDWESEPLFINIKESIQNDQLTQFIEKYNPNFDAVFFDDDKSLETWVYFIKKLFPTKELRVLISANHPQYSCSEGLKNLYLDAYKVLSKKVLVRGDNYKLSPGVAVEVIGKFEPYSRFSLNSVLMRLLFASYVLSEVKKHRLLNKTTFLCV